MAYMAYEYRDNEKIADIASQFNTTVAEIMKINHVNPPYPTYIKDLPQSVRANNTINVPFITNGKQSFETYNSISYNNIGVSYSSPDTLKRTMYVNANGPEKQTAYTFRRAYKAPGPSPAALCRLQTDPPFPR